MRRELDTERSRAPHRTGGGGAGGDCGGGEVGGSEVDRPDAELAPKLAARLQRAEEPTPSCVGTAASSAADAEAAGSVAPPNRPPFQSHQGRLALAKAGQLKPTADTTPAHAVANTDVDAKSVKAIISRHNHAFASSNLENQPARANASHKRMNL